MQVIEVLEKEIDDAGAESNERPGAKEWQGANFLLYLTFVLLLTLSSFVGSWGLREMQSSDFRLFPQAFVVYLFSRILPLYWQIAAWMSFLAITLAFHWSAFSDLNFGYLLGIGLAMVVIRKNKWPFWILAPISVHLVGILYLNVVEMFINSHNLKLSEYLLLLSSFSRFSIAYEMIFIYPLIFISLQLNKFINWFRMLE